MLLGSCVQRNAVRKRKKWDGVAWVAVWRRTLVTWEYTCVNRIDIMCKYVAVDNVFGWGEETWCAYTTSSSS